MKKIYLSIFCLFLMTTAKATENPTKKVNLDSVVVKKNPLSFGGYVDAYYEANLNNPKSMSNNGASDARAFDQHSTMFQVGMVDFKTTYSTDKVDGVFDLAFGNHADLANYGSVISNLSGTTSTALAIKQAYITWKICSKFSLTAGEFSTHIGYEVTDAPSNFNYSLSNLFANNPYYHTGIKGTYVFNSQISLMAGVVNGVDSKDDNNRSKGIISQLYLVPKENWNVYLNWMGSNEAPIGVARSYYNLFDFVTSYQITPNYLLGLNASYGTQSSKAWSGIALYSNYSLTKKFGLGIRYEYFDNKDGARLLLDRLGNGTSVNSLTLTGNCIISDNLLFKAEVRYDAYPNVADGKQMFDDYYGKYTKSSQTTVGGALIFHF